jgi:hypothetical protein
MLLEPALPPAERSADDEPHAGNLRQEGRRGLQGTQVKTKKNKRKKNRKIKTKEKRGEKPIFCYLFFCIDKRGFFQREPLSNKKYEIPTIALLELYHP